MQETGDTSKSDTKFTWAGAVEPMRRYPRETIRVIGMTAGVVLTVLTVPALGLLNDSFLRLVLIQSIGNGFVASLQASVIPSFAEMFPRKFRATGFGFPYALTVGLVGGTVAMIGTALADAGVGYLFPWYLVTLMAISTFFYITAKETAFKPLPD